MKILYLSRALLPSEISNSLSIMRVCQAFTDSGHAVVLTGLARRRDAMDPVAFYGLRGGFRVVLNSIGCLWDNRFSRPLLVPGLVLAWKTRGLVKSFAPDIVYSRLTLSELALVPPRAPILYEMHSLGFLRGSWLQRFAFRWLLRRKNVRRVVVTTDMLAGTLRSELPGIDVVVARLSAELPVDVSDEAQDAFRRANLQGGSFRHHVGYTGYLDTTGLRGTEVICQTAAHMPDAAFHIVGGEPAAVEHWRRYAEDYDAHGNIFFYGHRNPSEMPLFLGCFDVVLAPLQNRTNSMAPSGMGMSPLKLPQYMSYGKAIVASDIPSHREVLTDGETALLVPPEDINAWVAAIRSLLDDPERRALLGRNAVKRYWEGFSPDMRVRRILAGISVPAV
jgi:glycosyltransferase involved in cell wall biosynthesis